MNATKYRLGLDIGSVNAKLAAIDEGSRVVRRDIEKIISNTDAAVDALLGRLKGNLSPQQISGAGVTGSGRAAISTRFNWPEFSSSLAIASGLLPQHPDARTIIQIGGQTSIVMELSDGLKKPWRLASNPLCAAGTGRFLEQQAYRLGISLEDFAAMALQCRGKPPRIAARCSVFAKTDLIHLQQKGVPMEALLYALCESIGRMVASLKKGRFEAPIYFAGGVAANPAIVRALNEAISDRNATPLQVIVPEDYLYLEAIGAARLSAGKDSPVDFTLDRGNGHQRFFQMPRLEEVSLPGNGATGVISEPCRGYLGVDVGSTSTKAVIMDESGARVLAKNYLMTAGKPVDAVRQVFRNLLDDGAGMVDIAAAGVTGSGRYLVGGFIGADLIKNEITAQARAAAEVDADADIIEIGGQDSKLILKRNGTVVDYQMNKACAAGTGSFIDELAEMLQVPVKNGEFARLAMTAPYTIDLGTRCAAFMGQAVASAQQEGVPPGVLTASLAQSIARNYLTKVVGTRKLGKRIILTGAVFYNPAIVAAFRQQLPGKELMVAEQREVSGAIGAALLARESMQQGKSQFKGFETVVDSDCALSAFTCEACDNNCTITRMKLPDGKPTFYGSRCDRYDSTLSQAKRETLFDERERLLFRDYHPETGSGPTVGVPRALMIYEFAPLLLAFLNDLGVKVVLSGKTTKEVMRQAAELSYSDSCFPLKLLHGHVASLSEADFILYPCFIRLGRKDGDADQKYACPLVQASPFIVRHVLNLGQRLLVPLVDFSLGDTEVVENFTRVAAKLGFSRGRGRQAAMAGIAAQHRFETERLSMGQQALRDLEEHNQLGVVLLSRPYMAQDAGANLGIAEKLAQLGVVPLPLDFLPLGSANPRNYTDRPYWFCEGQHISGASIVAPVRRLYGLALTNFGCGPNSFILKMLDDVMAGKPMGELEIDEHAAEAGIVTRLEAFVDTIRGHAAANRPFYAEKIVYRAASTTLDSSKTLVVPRMCPHVDAIVASINACGGRAAVLPEPDDCNLIYAGEVTSGRECLPYRVTLGDFIRFCREHDGHLQEYEGLMASAYGPCRLGKYVLEQDRILKEMGFDLTVRNSISNNAYRDMNLDADFLHLALNCVSAVDGLQRLLWRTRPYEKEPGSADSLFDDYLKRISARALKKQPCYDLLRRAAAEFKDLADGSLPKRPLIGINGEVYLRSNRFSNRDLVKVCEEAGLEAMVSPMGEWGRYVVHRHLEDVLRERKLKKIPTAFLIRHVLQRDDRRVARSCRFAGTESSVARMLGKSRQYLSSRCGSEAVLSLGSGVDWLEDPRFAGVISVMPHGCMPGGVVAAMAEKFSAVYEKPWISVTYDGFLESNNVNRVREFAELVRFCSNGVSHA